MSINQKKEERIETRLSSDAKQQIEYAAQLQGRSVSDFVLSATLEEAIKVIEQQTIIRLSVKESLTIANAMLTPAKPNAKNIAAARRYKEKIGA